MHEVSRDSALRFARRRETVGEAAAEGVLIVVPLYKGPELLAGLTDAFVSIADELAELDASILLINDSPDHAGLAAELERCLPRLSPRIDVSVLTNTENLGFVRASNRGMAVAREARRDVLLLNSDAIPRPGAFREMVAVAQLDPMIGAVSPRSDNATICDSPYADELRGGDPERAYLAHSHIAHHLPRYTYVPTTVGFCMMIRWLMLEEFGLFDEIYGAGYNEEIDFVRRINRCGYRAVLANHAYVHHIGEASFSRSGVSRIERDEANRSILYDRYPECPKTIQNYFEGPEYQVQKLLGGLVPGADGRLNLLFDCRKLENYHSGTHEHMVALLSAFAAAHHGAYVPHVVCQEGAYRFHGLDRIEGIVFVPERDVPMRRFAAVMRIGQPFQVSDLELLESAAPIAGVLMLDTIALDCQHLDDTRLDILWQRLCLSIDLLGFNSRFSADQFNRRFRVPDRIAQFVSLCSTDVADYAPGPPTAPAGDAILVVGNHFPHKHVESAIAMLREADPDVPLTVLGVRCEGDGIDSYESGMLSETLVGSLYDRARVVVLPSHYEGFGLPIMHGLARGRVVVARDLPSAREIHALCQARANLHLAATTEEMVRLALRPPPWRASCRDGSRDGAGDGDGPSSRSWSDAADAVAEALARGVAAFDYSVCLSRRVVANTARLRLELAASQAPEFVDLPDPGQGYLIGRSLEQQLRAYAEAPQRGRFGVALRLAVQTEYALTLSAPRSRRRAAYVKVRVDDASLDVTEVHRRILPWLARLRPGGHIRLRLRKTIAAGDGNLEPADAVRLILIASGFAVLSLRGSGQWLVVHGAKHDDWQAMLPGPPDDLHFVHYLYRHMLGRHPDSEGADNYLRELAGGGDRVDLLKTFLCSSERRTLIGRQFSRLAGVE